jgi:hypothetical protein
LKPITTAIEVCPNCGDFTESLNESTGFCRECSPKVCSRCGEVPPSIGHSLCIQCQRETWWERNADQLEVYLSQGISLSDAREKIENENRAICISCGTPIPGRHRESTIFCSRTEECRRAKRSYIWKIEKGMPKDLALEEVVEQLQVESILREVVTNGNNL